MSYKGHPLRPQRIDLVVESMIVVEIKSVAEITEVFLATVTSYLRAGSYPLGLLINFNVPVLTRDMRRRINSRALSGSSVSAPSA